MEVRAIQKNTGVPASKVRPLANLIRGKEVEQALTMLKFIPTPKARLVARVVQSAAANAENNFQMDPADLKVVKIYVDEATSLRRYRPRSRGRVSPVRKRSSHITVVVAEQEG